MRSKYLRLNVNDLLKGVFIALITSLLAGIIKMIESGVEFSWLNIRPIIIAGVCAALSYLLKCLLSNSQDQLFTKEPEGVV